MSGWMLLLPLMASLPGKTYAEAYREATESERPLVVLVGAEWCPHCVVMKKSVLPQVDRRGGLARVAFATVDADHDPQLADQLMRGEGVPQLILFRRTAGGWQRSQLDGSASVEEVERFLGLDGDRALPQVSRRLSE